MKKFFTLILLLLSIVTFSGCDDSVTDDYPVNDDNTYESDSNYEYVESDYDDLSNDNYYYNVDGDKVHSPAYSENVPSGASAKCGDGTYSFSQNRRGTCSHHGGVAQWL